MGTPHKGSDLASFLDVINALTKVLFQRPADEIVKDLASNSRHLLELDQLLRFKLGSIDIYSFYELLPVPPLKKPVLPVSCVSFWLLADANADRSLGGTRHF